MADTEQRIDPEDGKAYTFEEIGSFYKGLFKKKAIQAYWDDMTPMKTKKKKAKKKEQPEVAADPNVEVASSSKKKFRPSVKKDDAVLMARTKRKTAPRPQKSAAKGADLGRQEEMENGIDLFTKQDGDKFEFQYTIQNLKLCNLEFTLDITGSKNMSWDDGGAAKKTVTVPSMDKVCMGTVKQQDLHAGANLALGFQWLQKPLDKAEIQAANAGAEDELKALADSMEKHGITASQLRHASAVKSALKTAGLENFVDTEFYPGDMSLFEDPEDPHNDAVIWKRPKDFMEGAIHVFDTAAGDSSAVDPRDINQGALGNCWFLAALSALAEFPKLIDEVFVTKHYNSAGVYEMKCYKNGLPTHVVVDDFFPCNPRDGTPCYTKSKGQNELWVLLLEKAWAKLHGTYEAIEGGVSYQAIMDLCGGTGKTFNVMQEKKRVLSGEFYQMLKSFDERDFIMCAGTYGEDNMTKNKKGDSKKGGIVPGHAYTLKSVKEAHGVRLLELRNPWGQYEWQGDWSDKSPLWTQQMKDAIRPVLNEGTTTEDNEDEDGLFWMSDKDFFKYFSRVSVVFHRGHQDAGWAVSRVPCTTKGCSIYPRLIEFEVDKPAFGFITMIQQDLRMHGVEPYISLGLGVYGPCSGQGSLPSKMAVQEIARATREVMVEISEDKPLEPGKYIVAIFNESRAKNRQVNLVLHFEEKGTDNEVPVSKTALDDNRRAAMCLTTALTSQPEPFGPLETKSEWLPNGGIAMVARNVGGGGDVEATFDFKACRGLGVYGQRTMQVIKSFPKGGDMELVCEMTPDGGANKSFNYGGSFLMSQ